MLNNASLNTYIQSWSRCLVSLFCISLIFLHILAFIFGVVQSPEMFHTSMPLGAMCKGQELETFNSIESSRSSCEPVTLFQKVDRLDELTFTFRFPSEETKPLSFSAWNWRILGNLLLEFSFEDENEERSVENSLNETDTHAESNSFNEELLPITLTAFLDVSPIKGNPEEFLFGPNESQISNQTESNSFSESWTRLAEFREEKILTCTWSRNSEFNGATGQSNKLIYICIINPLFDIHLVTNQSHIVSFRLEGVQDDLTSANNTQIQGLMSDFLTKPAVVSGLSLTLITESAKYHRGMFFVKCVSTPFVVMALLLFCVRMYLNDLYISIPDRLLITVALAQLVQNVPVEVLLNTLPDWPNLIYVKLLDDFGQIFLMLSMILFWIVYTKDKLAKNEPWERNTRYYWKQIVCICLGSITAALYITFTKDPLLQNPFKNHWQPESLEVKVSLGFIFSLAGLVMIAQTYLSILVFRVLCDVSVVIFYQGSSLRGGFWRLRMVLVYCLAVSVLTVGHFLLKLALDLSLHWNPQFYIDPIPFHLTFASAFFLGVQGVWNLHTISLLIMLSRGPGGIQDYIKPIKYMETGSTDQYELEMLHEHHAAPVPLAIRRRNPSHPRRQSSEDFLEAMDHKRNGSIAHDTENEYFHSNNHCDTYDSDIPDPGRSESSFASDPPMVDSPDMLESLRRETVHLWELSDNRSEPILELAPDDDDDDDLQSLAEQACYGQQRPKIVPSNSRGYER